MPIYSWRDKRTGKEIQVYRNSFDDSEVEPTVAEAMEQGFNNAELTTVEWEKLVSSNIRVAKTANWGGGKGRW